MCCNIVCFEYTFLCRSMKCLFWRFADYWYSSCSGDPRSVNSLVIPNVSFHTNAVMHLSIAFLISTQLMRVDVYQMNVLNHISNSLGSVSSNNLTNKLVAQVICVPAGTYSVVFVASSTAVTSSLSKNSPQLRLIIAGFQASDDNCSLNQSTLNGKKNSHFICDTYRYIELGVSQ